jgi:preprotein translocase subunit SecB
MRQPPLSHSPLQILKHEFEHIEIVANSTGSDDGNVRLNIDRVFSPRDDDPRNWRLVLRVGFGSDEEGQQTPYKGLVEIVGYFLVAPGFPDDKMEELIRVTGASILWGACREMIANLTARSSQGMITLPSISFVEMDPHYIEPAETPSRLKSAPSKRH